MKQRRKYRLPPPPPATALPEPLDMAELHPQGEPPTGNVVRLVPSGPPLEIVELQVRRGKSSTPPPTSSGWRPEPLEIIEAYPRGPKPDPNRPLFPSEAEIAALPRSARLAFAERCLQRVRPIARPGQFPRPSADPAAVAEIACGAVRAMFDRVALGSVRALTMPARDFARLAHNVRGGKWTDDTPIPPEVFGPMWDRTPPAWWTDIEIITPGAVEAEPGAA